MEAVQAAVEQACADFKDLSKARQAEQVLLQFRQSARPLPACRHVLDHSGCLEARFHAACTLREALIREWAVLSADEVLALRSYLLHYAVVRCASLPDPAAAGGPAANALRSTLLAALAVLVKRSWLDADCNPDATSGAAFFAEMQSVVGDGSSSSGDGSYPAAAHTAAAVQRAGIELLEALVTEFGVVTASPLGLPWDYHVRACRDMEERYLQGFFHHAVSLGRASATSGSALRGSDAGVCAACLTLMASILGWSFQGSGGGRAFAPIVPAVQAAASKRGELAAVAPGQAWSTLLLAPETAYWIVELLVVLASQQGLHPHQAALSTKARALLVAFCALSGEVLPRRPRPNMRLEGAAAEEAAAATAARSGYLRQMLRGVLLFSYPADAALARARAGPGEEPLLDACRCLVALSSNHGVRALNEASVGLLPGGGVGGEQQGQPGILMVQLEAVTVALILAGGVGPCDDEPWLHECADMCVEAWASLLVPEPGAYLAMATGGPRTQAPAAPQAASVFRVLVEACLRDAAAGAHEDADDGDEAAAAAAAEDWMVRAAALARASPAQSLGMLVELLRGARGRLSECAAGGADPSEVLEQVVWLLRMAAHALADSGAGETPLMPLMLLDEAEVHGPGAPAILALCEALLEVPALALEPGAAPVLSPRLMETCMWALSRWADTYLLPEEPLPGDLQQAYGAPTGRAGHLLDGIVRVALACLVNFPGEALLHGAVCGTLLPVLVRRKPLCRALVALSSWQELCHAFASRAPALCLSMGSKTQRSLAQCLCLASAGVMGPRAGQAYVTQLMAATVQQLGELGSRPDLDSVVSLAPEATRVACLVEAVRGCTRATLSATQPAVFALTSPLLTPLLRLQHAFRANPLVVTSLLKLAAEIVENHISFLRPAESDAVMRWVLELLQQYSLDNRFSNAQASAARVLQQEHHADQCRDLQALLKLLSHVTQRDIADADMWRHQSHPGSPGRTPGRSPAGTPTGTSGGGMHPDSPTRHSGGNAAATEAAVEEPQLDASQVVLLGLHIILPLLSLELLKFPKLCHLYFSLLSYVLEVYSPQAAELPPAHFATMLSSLEFGLSHADSQVAQASLEGLAGIARHQHKSLALGGPGFSAYAMPSGASATCHLLELLLRRLLLEDMSLELVDLAADALLPLMAVEGGAFGSLCGQLAASQPDPASAAKVAAALSKLLPPGGMHHPGSNLSQQTKRAFRQNLTGVVSDVRGLVRMR
ncbi:hypothetical protein FOA52_006165 [Chlamydomonas sp. UWO 241]|nr:hypothetical protein FOA52_006165 [Chlamydomonas sp. UWO 241]